MKYLFTVTQSKEAGRSMRENPPEMKKGIQQLLDALRPDAIYASTIRRAGFIVIDVKDPHVQLRKTMEALEAMGDVTIEPISTLEEFSKYVES